MTLNFGPPVPALVDRPHPILDLLCPVPVCRHAIRDHFAYQGPCAACWAEGVTVICRGLHDRRWPKAVA
ncbi:MAG: hypothetical protein AB7G21_09750 [Dehalococcoidia bacterium]